ncbi:MAG: nuclear transport factor 2 family protein [Dokdonella sp.]
MTPTPLHEPANGFLEAINRNDVAAFLAYFPDDGVVDDWGTRYVGHARIRAWSDREFIGVQVHLSVTGVRLSGNEISIAATVGGNGFKGLSRFVIVVDGQKIREMRITAD